MATSTLKTKFIRQRIIFPVSQQGVYETYMDSKKHSKFTGAKASISRKVGGEFQVYDGYASGKLLELVPNKRIVHTWRATDWPKGHFSKITITFSKKRKGTELSFYQSYVPVRLHKSVKLGWHEHYWDKMRAFLKK